MSRVHSPRASPPVTRSTNFRTRYGRCVNPGKGRDAQPRAGGHVSMDRRSVGAVRNVRAIAVGAAERNPRGTLPRSHGRDWATAPVVRLVAWIHNPRKCTPSGPAPGPSIKPSRVNQQSREGVKEIPEPPGRLPNWAVPACICPGQPGHPGSQALPCPYPRGGPDARPAGTATASAEGAQFFGPNRKSVFVFRSAAPRQRRPRGDRRRRPADTRRVATVKQRSGRMGDSNRQATGDRGRPPVYSAGAAEEQRRPRPERRRRPRSLRSRRIHAQPHHAESG